MLINSDDIASADLSDIVDEITEKDNTNDVSSNSLNWDEQYHITEDDGMSVITWMDMYCPNLEYADFENQPEEWWSNLTDLELEIIDGIKEYDDYFVDLLDEESYSDETIDEGIEKIETGIPVEEFYKGTVFEYATLGELEQIQEFGYDSEILNTVIASLYYDDVQTPNVSQDLVNLAL